ncbi:MAG TPA: isoleucine--tRNA ligase [Bacteroidetes bacterium]|nr:isoleucine--tRNA ligase [Bacteroidota bacterium]
MYKEYQNGFNLPAIEQDVLTFWEKNDTFAKSIATRPADKPFVFYEGPPTANGNPGIHHVLARTVKDLVCRLKTMQGFRVERKAGWDTHGLPVEIEVEKNLGIETKEQIIEYGVEKFNQKCRESVWKYKNEWDELTRRMGYWIDLDDPYITYENDYIESVWWILSELWKKDLIYQGHRILPYCPRCETPLSSHEVAQGYKDIDDPSIYVKVPLLNDPSTSFLVWTTTPWTLISNVALALNPELQYVLVDHQGEKLILAESRLDVLEGEYHIRQRYTGKELEKQRYVRIFDLLPVEKDAFYTVTADFVTADDGSGIVHIAPAFGEDDNKVGAQHDLPHLQPVDASGKFVAEVAPYAGMFFKEADKHIIRDLKKNGSMYRVEKHTHSYPHCWRCDTPLIYYSYESWYIRTTSLKERLLHHNEKIDWYPAEVGSGRFGEWLRNNVDWSLSRDRFWGTPLPIWKCDSCASALCVGSIAELKERAGVEQISDLHKPHVDYLTWACEHCDGTMRRVPEVIDVWFDSGSMPFAQWHYPFENKEHFAERFPADFISEGVDQTRGWFYSLLAISVLLRDEPSYKSCMSLELVLDKNGQKMSKTKGNRVDPFVMLDKYGADPVRWYLMSVSPPWLPTRFDEEGIAETVRKLFGTLMNTYNFFAMYANIDRFTYDAPAVVPVAERAEVDRWILSQRNRLVEQIDGFWQRYDVTKVARAISAFVLDDLSNWYVRRNRRRFWKSEMGDDKRAAYETLYEVLLSVTRLMAPIAPFISDELYRNLAAGQGWAQESVHLDSLPRPEEPAFNFRDTELESRMDLVRAVVMAGRSLRNDAGVRVRQPLQRLIVVLPEASRREQLLRMSELIRDELNIKAIEFADSAEAIMSKKAEPLFKKLGPKFGKNVNQAAAAIRGLSAAQIARLEADGRITLPIDGSEAEITLEDVQLKAEGAEGLVATMEGDLQVALDTRLTDELVVEGMARELVNRVQNMRKEAGYDVIDRIVIGWSGGETIARAIAAQQDYIKAETLAESLTQNGGSFDFSKEWKIAGETAVLKIKKIE